MLTSEILRAMGKIITGQRPSLSIEITRECPLRCPGCYAYDAEHLGGGITLRQLSDRKDQELIDGVMELIEIYRPLHVSLVGGDPLVRYRELEILVPLLTKRGIHVQIVTSAFRRIPESWASLRRVILSVSVDGLPAEHNARRAPATYDRILKNIEGQNVTIHCTITGQMMKRPGYLEEFLAFWTPRREVQRVWFSIFTPQQGESLPEMLTWGERQRAISDMLVLRARYPKLDMRKGVIEQFANPPRSPQECIFSQTTQTVSADLRTAITPCQFGGTPDCSSCGCMASMALAAIANHRFGGLIPISGIVRASFRIGKAFEKEKPTLAFPLPVDELRPLQVVAQGRR